jgi:hypothetical protein
MEKIRGNPHGLAYIQTNNSIEALINGFGKIKYLETCGPSAACSALSAIGLDPGKVLKLPVQPEDIFTLFFCDPNYKKDFQKIRNLSFSDYPPYTVPQYYPYIIDAFFRKQAKAFYIDGGVNTEYLRVSLNNKTSFVVCINAIIGGKKYGHYVAVVAYNEGNQTFCIHDPYPRPGYGPGTWIKQEQLGKILAGTYGIAFQRI